MANSNIFVTARRISPTAGKDLTTPKRYPIEVSKIRSRITNTKRGGSVLKLEGAEYRAKKIEVFESLNQIETLISPGSTEFVPEFETLNAAGANQGAAAQLSKYLTKVGTATGGSAEGFKLPVASGAGPFVIQNAHASVTVKIYPATGEYLTSKAGVLQAQNAALTLAPGQTIHFAVKPGSTTTWLAAAD